MKRYVPNRWQFDIGIPCKYCNPEALSIVQPPSECFWSGDRFARLTDGHADQCARLPTNGVVTNRSPKMTVDMGQTVRGTDGRTASLFNAVTPSARLIVDLCTTVLYKWVSHFYMQNSPPPVYFTFRHKQQLRPAHTDVVFSRIKLFGSAILCSGS